MPSRYICWFLLILIHNFAHIKTLPQVWSALHLCSKDSYCCLASCSVGQSGTAFRFSFVTSSLLNLFSSFNRSWGLTPNYCSISSVLQTWGQRFRLHICGGVFEPLGSSSFWGTWDTFPTKFLKCMGGNPQYFPRLSSHHFSKTSADFFARFFDCFLPLFLHACGQLGLHFRKVDSNLYLTFLFRLISWLVEVAWGYHAHYCLQLMRRSMKSCVRPLTVTCLSQAAAWDGLLYSVNYNGQNSGAQGYALPLFEE